jgi:phosphohistidine phosphatase
MSGLGLKFDVILTSPLKRSRETAEIVTKQMKLKDPVHCDELKPEGARAAFYKRLARLRPSSSILVVGHEPYLSTMLSEMISRGTDAHISIKKAGLAKVAVSGFAPRVTGELRWLLTPRQLRRMA